MTFLYHWFIGTAQASFTLGLPFAGRTTYDTFGQYFTALLNLAIEVAVGISTLIVVYAGFLYSHSQGQPQPLNQAKELIAGVLTGLAILFMIRLITPSLGISVR